MRLAIILYGISYYTYRHWNNIDVVIDFNKSYNNYKKKIIDHFTKLNYEIDVFIATYKNEQKNKIIKLYNPKKYIFKDFINKNDDDKDLVRNKMFISGLYLCYSYAKVNKINYDLVLITRFDIYFMESFENKLDLKKMNIVSILEHYDTIDDNLYIFPYKIFNIFIRLCLENIKLSRHKYKNLIEKIININYIKNEYVCVSQLSFYKLIKS